MIAPIFHVGYMKTATSWLQQVYFPAIENITYLGREHVNDFFLKGDVFRFDPEFLRNYYNGVAVDGKRMVFSSERLIGPVNKGYRDGSYIKCNADRIASVFPNAEILLLIRNQLTHITSCYMQYVRNGGNFSPSRYLHADENALFSFLYLDFYNIISYYKSIFSNVHVFSYEEFAENPEVFSNKLSACFGFKHNISPERFLLRVNPSIKPSILPVMKFLNLFSDGNGAMKYQLINSPKVRYYKNRLYHAMVRNKWFTSPSNPEQILGKNNMYYINSYYKLSNRRLVDEFGYDFVEKYNYPL